MAVVLAVLASTTLAASAVNASADDLVGAIPAVIRTPDIDMARFHVKTQHAVTPAEYRMLSPAGPIAVLRRSGGYKVSALEDRRHRFAIIERSCCALQEWIILSPARPLGPHATPATLRDVRIGGVSIGSPTSVVERQFAGSGGRQQRRDVAALRYVHQRNHDCWTFYTFVLKHQRVEAISVKNAC